MLKMCRVLILVLLSWFAMIPAKADTTLLGVDVRYDRKFDFSQLNNKYQWIKRKDSSREYYAATDPDINEYFLSVVNQQLAAKGFQQAHDGSASFGIDYEVVVNMEGKQESLENTLQDLRKKRYSKSHIPALPNIENMKAGSIILNILDMKSGYLIWIGQAEALVVEKENREDLIDQFVAKIMEEFPPE